MSEDVPPEKSRAGRLERRRGWRRRSVVITAVVVIFVGAGAAVFALVHGGDSFEAPAQGIAVGSQATSAPKKHTTTTHPTTTTTTIPPVQQPSDVRMPDPGGLRWGSRGGVVLLYEARMKQLHFDPGPIDGYFDQDTQYAVIAVQKYFNLNRTGVIDTATQWVLSKFRYAPAMPQAEGDRVEIDLNRQVLTVYKDWQPILISTTSTGSGAHFCGGEDGCQYAITPAGHYHFYDLYRGWKKGKLGTMWNPYFFNGGIAVHGLASVPTYPASHGCARVPMHIADYFYTLVTHGESVYVVGTPKQPGSAYVGPVHTAPTTTTVAPATTVPVATPTTHVTPKTTVPHTTPKTTVPHTTPTT
jgi:peptidoglycan hydrolase-like protein with peptidoglycan-binding domain